MKLSDFLLCVIDAKGGIVEGRTLLQKTCYFVSILLDGNYKSGFRAHFYGPYSPALDEALNQMVSLGLLRQRTLGFGAADQSGFEIRRNDFELTDEGKQILALVKKENAAECAQIQESVRRIQEAGAQNYVELSIAAKVYFIVSSRNERITKPVIISQAKSLGWEIEQKSIDEAVGFLERLQLVRSS
jgi:uncharacterized protein